MNIKEEMGKLCKRLQALKEQAAIELLTHGRTRLYRRLCRSVENLLDDLDDLRYLSESNSYPRVGFVQDPEPDFKTGFCAEGTDIYTGEEFYEEEDEDYDEEDD